MPTTNFEDDWEIEAARPSAHASLAEGNHIRKESSYHDVKTVNWAERKGIQDQAERFVFDDLGPISRTSNYEQIGHVACKKLRNRRSAEVKFLGNRACHPDFMKQ